MAGPGNYSRQVDIAAGTTSSTPLFYWLFRRLWATMFDVFHWRVEVARRVAYAKRAEECRWLADVCPEHLRESYLKLGAEYEQLAKKTDE